MPGPAPLTTTDYHTGGEPFRIVTGGVPELEGTTVLERRRWAGTHLDHVRRTLVNEPRGHADMTAASSPRPTTTEPTWGSSSSTTRGTRRRAVTGRSRS